jgi:hypothetical protein
MNPPNSKVTLVDVPVEFENAQVKFGKFVNAFRVVPDTGDECFLDFCVYSSQENRALVVARLRIHRSFLPIIYARLTNELPKLAPDGLRMEDGIVKTDDGRLVFFTGPKGEQ